MAVGTRRGVAFFDGGNWTIYDETNSGLVHDQVTSIFVDSVGDVWFGTYGRGVSRDEPSTGLWTTYSDVGGELLGRHILDIDVDAAGNMLFSNDHGGGVGILAATGR